MMIVIVLFIIICTYAYIRIQKTYTYWTERGVKHRKPMFIFGDNGRVLMRKESNFEMVRDIYNAFPDERYVGLYQMLKPGLIIRDPELIKLIAVKDFEHFVNHQQFVPEGVDHMWSKNLFSLKDAEWKHMRNTLSPSFTSSKMKIIFNLISDCADIYMEYFKKHNVDCVDVKDLFTRYATDIIGTVAFGIQCDSINDQDNQFYKNGKSITSFTTEKILAFFVYAIAPRLGKALGIKFFSNSTKNFFKDLVSQTIKIREEQGIVRQDMIHLLLEARNKETEITDLDIAAQGVIFFFAGFETISSSMCLMAYELALNPEVQATLHKEIEDTAKSNPKLTYEILMKMRYLDMVVSESLRKWPVVIGFDRICTKAYTIAPKLPNEKAVDLIPDDLIFIPASAIHRDPKYWPNPDKFDPERFSEENKDNIQPYTYLPFGVGPRSCIGNRFALLEMKTIFYYLLRDYEFTITEKTVVPFMPSKKSFNLIDDDGLWLGLKRRCA